MVAAIAAIAVIAAANGAHAAGLPSIAVHRTEDTSGCPDARNLASLVAQQMKRPALEPAPEGASARTGAGLDIQIYRSEEGFTAVLLSGTKTRTISDRGTTCAGLADALAISIAVLLDTDPPPPPPEPPPAPAAPREPREPTPPPAEEPKPPPAPAPSSPPRVPSSLPEVRSFHVSFAVSAVLSEGLLRPLGAGVSGDVEIRIGRFSIGAGALALPGQTIDFPTGKFPDGKVDVALTAGFARACGTVLGNGDAQRLALCAAPWSA